MQPHARPRETAIPPERDFANALRALAMDAVQRANSGHPGMPASGSALRFAYGSATRRSRQPFVHHFLERKHFASFAWIRVD